MLGEFLKKVDLAMEGYLAAEDAKTIFQMAKHLRGNKKASALSRAAALSKKAAAFRAEAGRAAVVAAASIRVLIVLIDVAVVVAITVLVFWVLSTL